MAIVVYQLIILNLVHLSLGYTVNTNVIKLILKRHASSLTPEGIGWLNQLGFVFDAPNERLFNKTKLALAWQKVDEMEENGEEMPSVEELKALPSHQVTIHLAVSQKFHHTKLTWLGLY